MAPTTPSDDVPSAAGRWGAEVEMGRLIAQQAWNTMNQDDQRHLLQRYREALRGELLMRYGLGEVTPNNRLAGSILPLREGYDSKGHLCRELSMDLVISFNRIYQTSIYCLAPEGHWVQHSDADGGGGGGVEQNSSAGIQWQPPPTSAAPGGDNAKPADPSLPEAVSGGWLPPLLN
jgi:hypothetical protein